MPGPKPSKKKQREAKLKARDAQVAKSLHVERRGGARVNAGRPPTVRAITKRLIGVREITSDIIKSGKVPLRVMINNMIHYDEQAELLTDHFKLALQENAKAFSEEGFLKAMELFAQLGDARMKAQKCACDAAPFLHPKLSQMTIDSVRPAQPRDLAEDADITTYREQYNQMRKEMLTLDNDTGEVLDEGEDA